MKVKDGLLECLEVIKILELKSIIHVTSSKFTGNRVQISNHKEIENHVNTQLKPYQGRDFTHEFVCKVGNVEVICLVGGVENDGAF